MSSTMKEICKNDANTIASERFQIEERKKCLLEKAKHRTITTPETYELGDILEKDPIIRNSDEGIRTILMIGLGALGGYALAKMFQPEPSCQR
ncbi:MAG: hypothetical protein ABH886_03390 [Candidatus Desantisbacteria bacterium]